MNIIKLRSSLNEVRIKFQFNIQALTFFFLLHLISRFSLETLVKKTSLSCSTTLKFILKTQKCVNNELCMRLHPLFFLTQRSNESRFVKHVALALLLA